MNLNDRELTIEAVSVTIECAKSISFYESFISNINFK